MGNRAHKFSLLPAAAFVLMLALPGMAEAPTREYQVKAAFIYNFMQFVEWPEDAFSGEEAPFVVGVVGADPFEGFLEQAVAGKTVGKRAIVVKHFPAVDQMEPCHLLFVPKPQEQWLTGMLRSQLRGRPTLTVGESDGFLDMGGMIRFFTEENKLRFEVNQEAVEKARLKVSSKLLKLAKIYKK